MSVDVKDFEEYRAEEKIHIIINVKDFKAIVAHAETIGVALTAQYSQPNRPLQFSYKMGGMKCEFTLMTTGDSRSSSIPTQNEGVSKRAEMRPSVASSTRSGNRSTSGSHSLQNTTYTTRAMPRQRNLGSADRVASLDQDPDPDSLFIPAGEDDRRWQPLEEQELEADTLGWDASDDRVGHSHQSLSLSLLNTKSGLRSASEFQ